MTKKLPSLQTMILLLSLRDFRRKSWQSTLQYRQNRLLRGF
ncbi:hypothetical protein [Helicobacter sp. T3_23-1056]